MKLGLIIGGGAAFLGYVIGYGRGMSNGVTAVRASWARAVHRDADRGEWLPRV